MPSDVKQLVIIFFRKHKAHTCEGQNHIFLRLCCTKILLAFSVRFMYVGCLVINSFSQAASFQIDGIFCQSPYSLSLVFRLGVDFV